MTLISNQTLNLPEPTEAALEASRALASVIERRIERSGGSLPFDQYMDALLNEPGLGYYAANIAGFDSGADFITAPELSEAFGYALANAVAPLLTQLGSEPVILELGAGSGVLAECLLKHLADMGCSPKRYLILEPSAVLRKIQKARLIPVAQAQSVRIEWLNGLPDPSITGVVVANEVMDALPVERFQITSRGPLPIHVVVGENGFEFGLGPPFAELERWLSTLETRLGRSLPLGYTSERCSLLRGWVASLSATLHKGALFLFDYGYEERDYYHSQRVDGTLLCHYRHRVHADPLVLPGLQDVTASVDFSALASAAEITGFCLAAYTTQSWFLLDHDLEGWMNVETAGTLDYLSRVSKVRTLMMPGEMGERIKVMVLAKELDGEFGGEYTRDMSSRL